jgi:hypothetical protein
MRAKNGQPRQGSSPGRGCRLVHSAKGPVSRILSCAVIPLGAALPRTLISDLPGGFGNCSSRLGASGRCAALPGSDANASLPIWSCSVWGLPCPRRYRRSGALLPHHFTLTGGQATSGQGAACRRRGVAGRYLFCGTGRPRALKPASRTLSGTLPCGVRTFLPRRTSRLRPSLRQRPPGPPANRGGERDGGGDRSDGLDDGCEGADGDVRGG